MQSTQWAIDRRMSAYVDAMLDVRGLFAASDSVERDELKEQARKVQRDSGAQYRFVFQRPITRVEW